VRPGQPPFVLRMPTLWDGYNALGLMAYAATYPNAPSARQGTRLGLQCQSDSRDRMGPLSFPDHFIEGYSGTGRYVKFICPAVWATIKKMGRYERLSTPP